MGGGGLLIAWQPPTARRQTFSQPVRECEPETSDGEGRHVGPSCRWVLRSIEEEGGQGVEGIRRGFPVGHEASRQRLVREGARVSVQNGWKKIE